MAQKEVELHIDKEKVVAHQQKALSKSDILDLFNSQDTVSDYPFRSKGRNSLYVAKVTER